jgi:hypothetical protein
MDSQIIAQAKTQAAKRGKSLSQLIADYVMGLKNRHATSSTPMTPLVASLRGILKEKLTNPDKVWRRHLEDNYK